MADSSNAPDNTPINKGVEDRVYAVKKEADAILATDPSNTGYQDFESSAKSIVHDFENMWIPLIEAGGIDDRAKQLAQQMADQTSRPNCLYQPDSITDTTGGDQTAFQSGDLSAGLAAAGADIASSAKNVAGAVSTGVSRGVEILVLVAVVYLLWKVS